MIDISTIASPIIFSNFLSMFGDITSSIECEYAVIISCSDKEYIFHHGIWFWLWIYYRTCIITTDELLLSDAKTVEIFGPPQTWGLNGVVAVLVSEVNFKGVSPKIVSPFLNASRQMKIMHARKTQKVI